MINEVAQADRPFAFDQNARLHFEKIDERDPTIATPTVSCRIALASNFASELRR